MFPSRLPQLTLALLLAVAACVVGGGAWLARRTETMQVPRDRAPLRDFAARIEEETRSLERYYESHLRQIANGLDPRNLAGSRAACESIVGIRQLSVLHAAGDPAADQHIVTIKPPAGGVWPEPALRDQKGGLPRRLLRLPEYTILSGRAESSGWINRSDQPLVFWQRRDGENVALVFVIERSEIAAVIGGRGRTLLAGK